MNIQYLEITYRRGKPVAAYSYLPRRPGDVSARTAAVEAALVTEYTADGPLSALKLPRPVLVAQSFSNETRRFAPEGLEGARIC